MSKRLYVTDLDGTLLTSRGSLSRRGLKGLRLLNNNNVFVTFATARSVFTSGVVLDHVNINIPIITCNGSALYDTRKRKFIKVRTIEDTISQKIIDLCNIRNFNPIVLSIKNDEELIQYKKNENEYQKRFLESRLEYGDKRQVEVKTYCNKDILNFMFVDNKTNIDKIRLYLLEHLKNEVLFEVYGSTSKNGLYKLHIRCKGSNKGEMIYHLADKLNINMDDVIVFGDEFNDVEMFDVAGYSIAVENSCSTLRKVADKVIGPNDRNAVINYIMKREGFRK